MASVIQVENLSKIYRLGTITRQNAWEDLARWWTTSVAHKADPRLSWEPAAGDYEPAYIWSLRDVSFSAEMGEVIGIIGRNGAGKSTLLKILSRITTPTSGCIRTRGRLASLLEIGTGFHPELTGRENVYLNGSILGMSKDEIREQFDEIVEFAEIGEYIDTPVKRYSSGMHVRLAFSVAAHLSVDILVVDEVLAVGDIAFQKKCLNKIGDAGEAGRTVLFVSHRMDHVTSLCQRSLVLQNGRLRFDGPTTDAMAKYYEMFEREEKEALRKRTDRLGRGEARVVDAWAANGRGNRTQTVVTGDDISLCLLIENQGGKPLHELVAEIDVYSFGNLLAASFTTQKNGARPFSIERYAKVEFSVPRLMLNAGHFSLTCRLRQTDGLEQDVVENATPLIIDYGDFHGIGQSSGGFISIPHETRISMPETVA
jgi:lipopolysaccharide transport system ATP-binding protein